MEFLTVGVGDRVVRPVVLEREGAATTYSSEDTIVARRFKGVKNICGEVEEGNRTRQGLRENEARGEVLLRGCQLIWLRVGWKSCPFIKREGSWRITDSGSFDPV
jgi:hypothetical protein